MSRKSIKYTDVFNNPYNDYVCPTFPTCANSNNDDYYFEFIDKKSVGIVNNMSTIQSMDLSNISSYAKSWSQDTKVIQPNKTLFIKGDEFGAQHKAVGYREVGTYPIKELSKAYYLHVNIVYFDKTHANKESFYIPVYAYEYDLGTSVEYLNKYLVSNKIPISVVYDNTADYTSLDIFDTDGDGRVDVWWDGEMHRNGVIIFESTDIDFKFDILHKPCIKMCDICDAYKDEKAFIIVNDKSIDTNKLYTDVDISDIIESMDGSDRNSQANIYWSEFDGAKPTPNKLIPQKFDTDSDGYVDVVWDDLDDSSEVNIDVCVENVKNSVYVDSIKFEKYHDVNYFKYPNGAFKGISMVFKYPSIKNKYGTPEKMDESMKYLNYVIPHSTFKDVNGEEKPIYMDGPLFNANQYIEYIKANSEWCNTSLIYMNVSNDTELIPGMLLYNPHTFPIAVTYIKFN